MGFLERTNSIYQINYLCMGPSINHVQVFRHFYPHPPPSWTLLQNKAYEVNWSFWQIPSPSTVDVIYGCFLKCCNAKSIKFNFDRLYAKNALLYDAPKFTIFFPIFFSKSINIKITIFGVKIHFKSKSRDYSKTGKIDWCNATKIYQP